MNPSKPRPAEPAAAASPRASAARPPGPHDPCSRTAPTTSAVLAHPSMISTLGLPLQQELVLLCRVTEVEHIGGGSEAGARVHLRPALDDRELLTLPITDLDLARRCALARHSGALVRARGVRVPEPPRARRGQDLPLDPDAPLRFQLQALEPGGLCADLLSPRGDELSRADRLIDRLRAQDDGLFLHIVNQAYAQIGVAQKTLSARALRTERLIVLQALSGGQIEGLSCNPRLSVYIASGPGRGKRIFTEMARLFAPVSHVAQPALLSLPGLTLRAERSKGGFRAVPGVLPACAEGTFILEDAHRVEPAKQNGLQTALLGVLEEGRLTLSKAGTANYQVPAAVLLNGNPLSTLPGFKQRGDKDKDRDLADRRAADLNLPLDLLSRVDVTVYLDGDEDPVASAQEMATLRTPPRDPFFEERPEVRDLKLLLARLRERFAHVDLRGVERALFQANGEIGAVLREVTARSATVQTDALVRRMQNSLRKLTVAAARLGGRGEATQADVDLALEMISMKIEVLRWLAGDVDRVRPNLPWPDLVERAEHLRGLRQREVLQRFGGRAVKSSELAAALGIAEDVLRRDLAAMGILETQGHYPLPTEAQHHDRVAAEHEARQRGAAPPPAAPAPPAEARRAREAGDQHAAWEEPLPPLPALIPDDGLPTLPQPLRELARVADEMTELGQGMVRGELIKVVFREEVDSLKSNLGWAAIKNTVPEEKDVVRGFFDARYDALWALVTQEDREARSLGALSLLGAMKWHTPFALQADLTYALHELPDKQKAEPHKWPPLPPRIESGVRALLRRLGPMVAAEYAGYGIPAPAFLPEV